MLSFAAPPTGDYCGTHMYFIDAESPKVFDEVREILEVIPTNVTEGEVCRLTVFRRASLSAFVSGKWRRAMYARCRALLTGGCRLGLRVPTRL